MDLMQYIQKLIKLVDNVFSGIFLFLIKIYKICFSGLMGGQCRFYPTCSTYAAESIKLNGFFKSIHKIVIRILKCNQFFNGGYDPVIKEQTRRV